MPDTSFTYVSEAWDTTSWLDHIVTTADAHDSLESIEICYGLATTDHIPVAMLLNVESVPLLANNGNAAPSSKLDWSKLTKEDMHRYSLLTDSLLSDVELPRDALMCTDMNCKDKHHAEKLCAMYDDIVKCLYASSEPFINHRSKVPNIRPGWNEFVSEQHAAAREAFRLWSEADPDRECCLITKNSQMLDLNMHFVLLRKMKTQ